MRIRSQVDFWSGVVFLVVGVAFAVGSTEYRMGTSARPGPGYFPLGLGVLLALVGLIVLVGLACKNAILIVEFAREKQNEGMAPAEAALTAATLRLRPILMTSIAFIAGVYPLVTSTGAGAEMRRAMGTAVFSGMIGVTFFGLLMTPVFYFVLMRPWRKKLPHAPAPSIHPHV